ncbi:MAG: hypothetical protein ACI35S_05405 [Anaeroplasma sp.]
MPEIRIIGGIECVFPESAEKSLQQLSDLIMEALHRCFLEGKIPPEKLDDLIEQDKINRLDRPTDESL